MPNTVILAQAVWLATAEPARSHGRQPAKRIKREQKVREPRGKDKRGRAGPQRFGRRGGGWEGYHRGR